MLELSSLLSLVAAGVSAAALVYIMVEIRQIKRRLRSEIRGHHGPPPWYGMPKSPAGYAIFVWKSGAWHLQTDMSQPGFKAKEPTIPGTYDGQVVKTDSEPV